MLRFRSFAELILQLRNLRMREVKDAMQKFNEAARGAVQEKLYKVVFVLLYFFSGFRM